jgi:hypothetical protein
MKIISLTRYNSDYLCGHMENFRNLTGYRNLIFGSGPLGSPRCMNAFIKWAENETTLLTTWGRDGEEKLNTKKAVKLDREYF